MTTSADNTPAPRLPALLRIAWQQSQRRILAALAEAGFDDVRLAHWPVIQYPGPDGARPSELADRAGVSKQAINYLIRDLEGLGYLRLARDPSDSRARLVRLTPRGSRMIEAVFESAATTERTLEERLTARQRSAVHAALEALADGAA